ncbi:alpha-N-acetylglucosaminidase C-terminal domain-containing protein [Luteolibacter arcticus]|uniref:Alpha-N-acetylglucosaminidase C-terminal domain-containing protein n=1 Tax=Luteolibacter arcticus TaxID=1581411 RepID=A0ABT3GF77_9BACT|nr:alpha-N-acetylglucosaminidase TIM-barrel domain-containing protein [Luteolibacter arcticus]MCW1922268.1 alpha-N-acetylglucosaminidase C-terminal domain-containing protein [Luteolibacter arcticus]
MIRLLHPLIPLLMLPALVQAVPIASDDFDYPAGGAAPMDGGSGWGEPWKASNGTTEAALNLAAGSLDPLGQGGSGNSVATNGNAYFRALSASAATAIAAESAGNGEVWISFTAQQGTAASGFGSINLWNAGSTNFTDANANYSLMLGRNQYDQNDWSWTDVTTVGAGSLGNVPVTTAVRYVMRLDYQATQTAATMYVFTNSSQVGADIASSTPATSVPGNIANGSGNRPVFDRIRLSGNNGMIYDSLRIGTTFGDVMPVAVPVAPTIASHPAAATASEFGSHTFSVQASGSPTLTYQWKKGTQVLEGQTSATLTLSNLSSTDAGSYSVTVSNGQGSVPSNGAALTVDAYPRDLTAASGLLSRLLPGQAGRFIIEFVAPANGMDVFEIEGRGEKIVLRGNTSVSVASALNRYLMDFCHCHVSRNGDQLALPAPLPLVPEKLRVISPHRVRFFYNPCTFGYTSAWWNWSKWEREIDMLALQGVNVAQVTPGIEEVFRRTLCDHFGYTDAEVRGWLCHPSHLPWMLLSNMHSFAGPVSDGLITGRVTLGRQICDRMRALGMAPMVQGFYGMVPQDFKTRFPAADVRGQGGWAGGFQRPNMLNPTDPIFDTFTTHYAQALTEVYGPVKFVAADPFHEGGDTSGIDLAAASQAVLAGISKVNPQATWVLEAWGGNPIQAMLDAVDKQRLLVLDLNCTTSEGWRSRNAFNQTPWVWCAIMNFGGNTGMDAALSKLASMPAAALADPARGPMAGIGMVPEGSHTIPAAYDLLFTHSWRATAPDLTNWSRDYALRRYGVRHAALDAAWDLRRKTTDNPGAGEQEPHNSIVCARPGLSTSLRARTWASTNIPYHAPQLATAWGKMLEAAPQAGASDAYRFDLADTARQVLCDLATRHQRMLAKAKADNNAAAVHIHGDRILEIIADLDTLCATRPDWLLGTWLSDARSWGGTAAEKDLCERNARLLLTTWGNSVSDLNDYANREWAGLLSGFYRPRWQQFLTALYASVDQGTAFNEGTVRSQIGAWELAWSNGHEAYPTTTTGDTIEVAAALWAKYGAEAEGSFDLSSNTVSGTWSPAVCSASPAKWTRPAAEINQPGIWCVTFQYTSGSQALQIHEVALHDGATLIERDIHPGWTGWEAYDNRYYFRVASMPADLSLAIIANGAGGTNSNGTITVSRCEMSDIGTTWTPADCATTRRVWRIDAGTLVNGNGLHQLALTRSGGGSAITIDRAWTEQNGTILAEVVADETLDAANSTASWTLDVAGLVAGQPVHLFIATGSATSAGSSGTLTLSSPASSAADPMSWQRWASELDLDPEQPDLDSDGDGVADLIEFLQDSDPAKPDATRPLALEAGQLSLQLASDRTGADVRIESSTDLDDWAEDESLVFLGESEEAGEMLTRIYQVPGPAVLSRYFRLRATRLP